MTAHKVQIDFKDPDAVHEILQANPKAERLFEFSEYGRIEIDTVTLECKLVPVKGR